MFPLTLKHVARVERDSATCTVLGTARCVHDDVARHGVQGDVMVLSHALMGYMGLVHHAVSMHWDKLCEPLARLRGSRNVLSLHSFRVPITGAPSMLGAINHSWRASESRYAPHGTGHFGVLLALSLGYSEVRLLGVPMDAQPHFYDLGASTTNKNFPAWLQRWALPADSAVRIRSASGYTAEVFGWL